MKDFIHDARSLQLQDSLSLQLGGETHVKSAHGFIGVLTPTEIIEVKHIKKYLHAIGQVLGSSLAFPDRLRRIHLFGSTNEVTPDMLSKVTPLCEKYKISVTYEIL